METKRRGSNVSYALITVNQALALPLDEDKQHNRQPTSVNIYSYLDL